MKKLLCCLLTTILLCSCASKPAKIETVTVYKPVYTPPESIKDIKQIPRPDVSSNYLTEQDKLDPGKVVKSLLETIAQLRIYAEQLENNDKAYRDILNTDTNKDK
jgi:hypothetical protein